MFQVLNCDDTSSFVLKHGARNDDMSNSVQEAYDALTATVKIAQLLQEPEQFRKVRLSEE